MLYWLETVALTKRQEAEMEVSELKMLRVTIMDKIGNSAGGTTGVARIFVWGGTRPTPPSHASVVHTFEAVAGSWGSVSAPAANK